MMEEPPPEATLSSPLLLKVRTSKASLVEEEPTLEWAGISFEQGLFQWLIRIAQISGVSCLLPLLSGNAG